MSEMKNALDERNSKLVIMEEKLHNLDFITREIIHTTRYRKDWGGGNLYFCKLWKNFK